MRPLPIAAALCLALSAFTVSAQVQRIAVTANEAAKRVDVTIDGKPFTSYLWPSTQKKPVLYPLLSANGTAVSRGYPLEPRQGERTDHPHHAGLWFNHGDVNGFDFWNNLDDITGERVARMGTIHHRRIVEATGGRRSRRARRGSGMDRRRRLADHSRTDALCVPRLERHAQHRSHHDADGDRAEGAVPRQQRGNARHSRGARAGAARQQAEATVSGLYVEQRRQTGRCGVGHARPVDAAWRTHRRRARSRSPFSIIPATRAIRRIGTHAGTGCSRPIHWGRRRSRMATSRSCCRSSVASRRRSAIVC